ncbi:permease-like cell division protein FtsX [bacterium]|nr:permease-like cell division protein FtsX [bacterium]
MFTTFLRIIKFAGQSFARNIWLSVINITILVLTLLTINFLIIFNLLTTGAVDIIKDKVDVSVYFKENVADEQIQEVQSKILDSLYIDDVQYISPEQALKDFKAKHESDQDILQAVTELEREKEAVFLPSIRIKAQNISLYGDILKELKESQYSNLFEIDEAQFRDYATITEKINTISNRVEMVGYIVSLIFLIIAFMMVYNTIKVAIYTHQEEISIMKLVGATNNFIKSPFIVEIIFYNIIALLIVVILFYLSMSFVQPMLNKLFAGYSVSVLDYYNSKFLLIFLGQFIFTVLFSVSTSLMAMKKYLKI